LIREGSLSRGEIQLVVFNLHGEEFGVDIKQVKEVLKLTQVTHLPHTAEYIQGVINLRGDVIPVIKIKKDSQYSGQDQFNRTAGSVKKGRSQFSEVGMRI